MSLVNKIDTDFYIAESYPNKTKILWKENNDIKEFEDSTENLEKNPHVSFKNFNRIHFCSKDEILFVWNNHLYYIKNNEYPILLLKNVCMEHIFYAVNHKKIVIIVDGNSRDFVYIYSLEDLKNTSGDLDIDNWVDSFPWNNQYTYNNDFIFCLHDDGIYAMDINNLNVCSSDVIHYVTEKYEDELAEKSGKNNCESENENTSNEDVSSNDDETYASEDLIVTEDNIISHVLLDNDGYKKIIKIKFIPSSGKFFKISEEEFDQDKKIKCHNY